MNLARVPSLFLVSAALSMGVACKSAKLLQIVGPGAGSVIAGAVTLQVQVTELGQEHVDSLGGLDRVEFFLDDTLLCTDYFAPFACDWNPGATDNGPRAWRARAVVVAGQWIQTPDQDLIVDVPSEHAPGLLGFLPGLGGALDIVVSGDRAYVASDPFGLSVVDGISSSVPRVTAASSESFAGERVALVGNRAVAIGVAEDGTSILWVLDVAPAGGWPAVLGEFTTSLEPSSTTGFHDVALTASGSHAVVAAGSDGVWILDLSNPAAPQLAGSWSSPEWNSWALGVAVANGHVFVANGGLGVKVLSLANPSQPALVGTRMLSGTQQAIAVSGTRAYVASQTGSLRVLDVANPASPLWLGTGTMSGVGQRVSAQGTQVATLAAGSGAVLDLFDASNPYLPVRTGSVVVGALDEGRGVALAGGRAYVAAAGSGVQVYDASAGLPFSGLVEDRFAGDQMAAEDGLAVVVGEDVVTGHAHLQVVDLANPSQPAVVGELATSIVPGSVTGFHDVALDRARNLAAVAAGADGLWIVDVSNPFSPSLVASYDTPGWVMGLDLDASGTRAYLADGTGGLKIVDLTNPGSPQLMGSLSFSGTQRDVAVQGDTAFVVNQGGTLRVVDVANPASPRWIGSTSLGGFGYHVAVSGDVAVVHSGSSSNDYLDVIDVSDAARPSRVASLPVAGSGEAGGVDVLGDRAAVAAGAAGLLVYDVSNPGNPTLVSEGEGVGAANDAVLEDGTACSTGFPATVSIVAL